MSDPQDGQHKGIPFTFFCSLVREISKIKPTSPQARRAKQARVSLKPEYTPVNTFAKWVGDLRQRFHPLPPNTTAICFRFLFPEDDSRRTYEIKEKRMAELLQKCYVIKEESFDNWSLAEASGCLGQELKVVLNARTSESDDNSISEMTIADVAELLDELAAHSSYSHESIRLKFPKKHRRTRDEMMRVLFRPLSPADASVLTQIILKDLKPLLYPLSDFHYSTALTKFNAASVKVLTLMQAMKVWDPSNLLLRFYNMRCSLDEAGAYAESPSKSHRDINPAIGSQIAVPKSQKALSYQHTLDFFANAKMVWGETKYDGERAQIHVQVEEHGSVKITIFSKSKRDSTGDRNAIHPVILRALGLDKPNHPRRVGKRQVKQNIILDAEMVPFRGTDIEEFWRIKKLVDQSAVGARKRWRSDKNGQRPDSYDDGGLSLGLVFFDIMYLDSASLCWQTYAQRRATLESLIEQTPGEALLAARYPIDMTASAPEKTLEQIFKDHLAAHEEGLVLKAEDSRYNDWNKPWVKLKKDYMPDAEDHINMVILGACWEKKRGRILRVSPSTYTTFHIGGLEKGSDVNGKPSFHVYFTVSYGLNRTQLDELNFLIRGSDHVPYSSVSRANLPYNLSVLKGMEADPTIILRTPLLAEMFGAGFTKSTGSYHYEPRFPRITKFYRASERSWKEGLTLQDLHEVACKSVGRDPVSSLKLVYRDYEQEEVDKDIAAMWAEELTKGKRKRASSLSLPSVTSSSPLRQKTREEPDPEPECNNENTDESSHYVSPERTRKRPRRESTSAIESIMQDPATPVPQPLSITTNMPISPVSLPKTRTKAKTKTKTVTKKTVTVPVSIKQECVSSQLLMHEGSPTPSSSHNWPSTSVTPSRNTIKTELKTESQSVPPVNVHESDACQISPDSPQIHQDDEHTVAWFPPPRDKRCDSCILWKKELGINCIRSLDALLHGCGWPAHAAKEIAKVENYWVKKGMIVIDECDAGAEALKLDIRQTLDDIKWTSSSTRTEIVVFSCKSRTKPLYRVV